MLRPHHEFSRLNFGEKWDTQGKNGTATVGWDKHKIIKHSQSRLMMKQTPFNLDNIHHPFPCN